MLIRGRGSLGPPIGNSFKPAIGSPADGSDSGQMCSWHEFQNVRRHRRALEPMNLTRSRREHIVL